MVNTAGAHNEVCSKTSGVNGVRIRQKGDLLTPPAHLRHRFAEVDLGIARWMVQRREYHARRLPSGSLSATIFI